MAEAVLYNISARIIWKLGSSFLDEIWLLWGVKDELEKLKATLSTIEAVLLDAEEKSMENLQVKHWLGMLSDAMYDADDLVDSFSTQVLRQQVMAGSKAAKEVRIFFSRSNQFSFGIKMTHKVKALRKRLDEIAANRKFHLEERYVERVSLAKGRDQTHSSPPQLVIGRDDEKEAMVKLLLTSSNEENVSVVPIVGIGGLGKTTLAQLVYNDHIVQKHFELKIWVCVSEDFNVQLLVRKVLESTAGETPNVTEMDPLKSRLHQKINGRKYLLVLDDVWNEDVSKWFSLKDLLAGGAKGSKIVITTRLRKVAEMSRPICIHELRGLSEDDAWSLFKHMAFKQGQVVNPSHEAIGREIVANCCGVPLAIRAIGGMMYVKDLESEWLLFKNEELLEIDIYREDILPILKLSYNHLPSHYKHCFAYCSLYPKDFKIPVKQLIHLWKAQGYLKSADSDECLQDVGFGCFMDLFRLSFFQDVEMDDFGNIKYCKMHDLMHDLAISVARDNYFVSHSGITSIKDKTRHISFRIDENFIISQDISLLLKAKKIRTILPLVDGEYHTIKEEVDVMICNLRCLRALSFSFFNFDKLPSSIYKLKHLRHLNLSNNNLIKKLPDSITNLQNLQVLILSGCSSLEQLPANITKLVNLTDLDNDQCEELTHMPRGIGQLTRLETLSLFVIAMDNSISKHSAGLDELHALNNLRGSLEILNLECVKNPAYDFKAANLNAKQLHKLTLCWNEYDDCNNVNDEKGLEALRPHQSLKELSILNYRGARPPSWLLCLTNLVSVHLCFCNSIQWLPPLDQLPFLKNLLVLGLTNLEHIYFSPNLENRRSSSFFPSLTYLRLHYCPNLKGFVRCKADDVGMKPSSISTEELPCFPLLSELTIDGCPNLTYMPLLAELISLTLMEDGVKSVMEVLKMQTTSASESTSSPFSTLSQLEDLNIWEIEDCAVDQLLPYLPSLQFLLFMNCKCTSLSSDENDDGKQWQNLKVLRSVIFINIENLVSLPKGLQYVTTLQLLHVSHCGSLASIPEWMGRLIELEDFIIHDCSQLSERCKNNMAEDWSKISHIPCIYIDNNDIQIDGCYLL